MEERRPVTAEVAGSSPAGIAYTAIVPISELEFDPAFPVKDLRLYYRNAKKGNVDEIKKSLGTTGQYRTIVVNRGTYTARENEVLAGNHTLKAARELGWTEIAVNLVDVDDDQARKINLVDNRTSDLGTYDKDLLAAEIAQLQSLHGSGYSQEDLDRLLADDDDPLDSGHEESYTNRWELVVECTDEEHQRELYAKFMEEGLTVRVLSL